MALKVVLPEFLLPPLMVIVILPPNPRYHSRVSPAARLRKIDLHCMVMPSPTAAMLYQVVKYHTSYFLKDIDTNNGLIQFCQQSMGWPQVTNQ